MRNKLTVEHVKKLITVSIYSMSGENFDDFDSENVLKWFVLTKKRVDIYDRFKMLTNVFNKIE